MSAALPAKGNRATIGVEGAKIYEVQFNPVTLVYEFTNTLKEEGKGQARSQYTTQTSAKLSIDLMFDTTDRGISVTDGTRKVLAMAKPVTVKKDKESREVPPVVVISWGAFEFKGVIESYKETIDYFSHEGVPLRAQLNLKLSEKVSSFGKKNANLNRGSLASDNLDTVDPPADAVEVPPTPDESMQDQANKVGDPGMARELAAANGIENLRAPLAGGAVLGGGGVALASPAAFAVGGGAAAGFSAGAGIGAGASAGFGAGASAGFGAGASAGFGAGASAGFGGSASAGFDAGAGFGAGASAGFSAGASAGFSASGDFGFSAGASAGFSASASAGVFASDGFSASAFSTSFGGGSFSTEAAFSGLRVVTTPVSVSVDTSRLLPPMESVSVSIERSSSFSLGGKALVEGSASLSADVGAGVTWSGGGFASASGKIRFDD